MDATSPLLAKSPKGVLKKVTRRWKESSWGQTTPVPRFPGVTLTHLSITAD